MHIVGSRRRSWCRAAAAGAGAAALGLALVACGSDDGSGVATSATSSAGASRYATPLKGVCPDTVVVQTNWWPEPDHGFTYQLLGPNPTIDAGKNRVVGPLGATGVKLEIRAGGPAVGFQPVSSTLAQNDDVLFGYVGTDEAVEHSGKAPTVAVFSSYEKNPQVFIWGNPDYKFASVADIGKTDVKVLGYEGAPYLEVFKREGLLKASQIDASYQGAPDRFVAADGNIAMQGFVTNEPYHLEHDVKQWSKPVHFLLVEEYPVYQSALAVRKDTLAANRACLEKIVPLFQQAQFDYVADPGPVNELLLQVIPKFNTGGFALSAGLMADANDKQKKLGLIANGRDGVLGSFENVRVAKLIAQLAPVFEAKGSKPAAGLKPGDLVTNEFLDDSISLK
jgi:hypothetical protein